ncbi:MAG TPA: GAF domain-containing protein [Halomicronema sp.]
MSGKPNKKHITTPLSEGDLLNRITNRIRQSLELQEILSATAAEMRSFLDIDRVKVYRFEEDSTGIVIAESIYKNKLPALLGLHFPASDIPPHAREMYVKARTRTIVDVVQQQIILNRQDSKTTGDLTLEDLNKEPIEDIIQRPVDPCHIQYLRAMGVQSSLVVPVMHQQQLWGILAAHHSTPKSFSSKQLRIVQMIANQMSVAISQSELLTQARAQARREALINQVSTLLHAPLNIKETLQSVLEKIVTAVGGCGGRLYIVALDSSATAELFVTGCQPQQPQNTNLSDWLEHHPYWQSLMGWPAQSLQTTLKDNYNNSEPPWSDLLPNPLEDLNFYQKATAPLRIVNDIYQELQLVKVAQAFNSTQIRGLLVMPMRYGQYSLGCLSVFRNQIDTDIVWAGRFNPDQRNQRVRDSFEAWRETKLGQAYPWKNEEVELVQSLGTHVAMAVMQNRLFLWEREHRLLVEMRNQELKAARAAAEQASRLKSDFLSSTSHELRTPLASTINYLKLLKEEFYDNEVELKEYISIAYQSAENLVAIINDVLDIAKIEAGRMSVNFEPVHLQPMFEELRRLFSVDSRRKNIPLIVECEVETVWADHVKMRQILTNLLSNAFKFTTEGEIRLKAIYRPLVSSSHPPTNIVEISVADTGIGIEANQRDMVFEPFVQADGSIKRRYGGTGLGLTVCKRLVQLMEGQIRLESPGKNQGTTVTFSLPCKK